MAGPAVSVIIPVHDRAQTLGAAIRSVLGQTLADFELIVVDDGSSDGSAAAAERFRDPRIRVLRSPERQGIPRARNRGLGEARGSYVAWLDSDDLAQPRRLEQQVDFLERRPEVALVGSWAGRVDARGGWTARYKVLPTAPDEVHARLLLRCSVLQYSMTGRAEILKEFGYREEYPVCQDYDLLVRLAARHRIANLPSFLVRRRVHDGSVTVERQASVEAMNLRIIAEQLERLGVDASDEDLGRHFRLTRPARFGAPDVELLEWAEAWFQRLEAANEAAGIYAGPALRRVLGRAWLEAWLYALPRAPARGLRRLGGSPLRSWAGAGAAHSAAELLGRALSGIAPGGSPR